MGLLVESTLLEVSLLLTTLFSIGYLYIIHIFSYWTRHNVKSSYKPSFPFGHFTPMFLFKKPFYSFIREVYESTKEDFIGLYVCFKPVFLVRNIDLCRNILVTDFNHFHDRGIYSNEKVDFLSAHLVSLKGEKWKQLRATLTPAFTSVRLKGMFQTLIDCGNSLETHLKMRADESTEFDMRDLMARYVTNIIASVAFGFEVDSILEPNAPFREFGRKAFAQTLKTAIRLGLTVLLPNVAEIIKLKTQDKEYEDFMISIIKQTIEYRESNNIQRKDLMQLLLQLRNTGKIDDDETWNFTANTTDNIKKLSIKEIAAHVHIFFLAGYETSSSTSSFCLYEMARNPQIQEKAQQEIDQVLKAHEGKWSYDALMEMKYLDRCIDETIRMYPGLPILSRECTADYQIPGTKAIIKKGTSVIIPTVGIHYDAQYFKDPNTFQPERFNEGSEIYNSLYYQPFGGGPHYCIGARLGKMAVKIAIAITLSKFNIHLGEKLKHNKVQFARELFIPVPVGGLNLTVSHRKL